MNVFDEFLAIARELEQQRIAYALVGGVAMAFHDLPRFTEDIDLLIVPEDAEAFLRLRGTLSRPNRGRSAVPASRCGGSVG